MKKAAIIFIFVVFCAVAPVQAAALTLEVPKSSDATSRLVVDVLLDTGGESINSAAVSVSFPADRLRFVGYSRAESSIPIWVTEPKEVSIGTISFAGIIPGGIDRAYDPNHPQNKTLRLTKLFFVPQKAGEAAIAITNSQILRNDGKGTVLTTTNGSTRTTITTVAHTATAQVIPESTSPDNNPPLPFVVTILPESIFGRTPRLAVFSARDQESGIHHYEARIGSEAFHEAISPLPLPYRLFSFTLTVRAVDFFGNSTDEEIVVEGENAAPITFVTLGLLLAVVFYRYVRWKRIRAHESKTPTL